jgi:hypothetical protein
MLFSQDVPVPPSLPGTDPAVITTNVVPVVIAPTNRPAGQNLPIVEGGTNSVMTVEERKNTEFEKARKEAEDAYEKKLADAKKKWEAVTNNLGIYHLIPERNPFKLIKPEIEKPKVRIIPTITVGVPHLVGISMLRNNMRAVLRINPPEGGPAEYKFIEVGERIWEVEVLKIDPEEGIVEVKVKNGTHSLELIPTLRVNVRELQQALNVQLKSKRKLKVDGDFGSNTRKALMEFQRDNKLAANGQVDEATRKALGLSAFPKRTKVSSPRN